MISIRLVAHNIQYAEEINRLSQAQPVKDALGLPDQTIEDTKKFIQTILEEEKEYKCQHKYVHFRLHKDVQNYSFSFAK